MPPKSKSIFRQPGVQHFQLVHRSQRDPRINDPSASSHVLKAFERENVKKGKTRAELENSLGEELRLTRENEGEASVYGIYYDDTDYDYMQHLRTVGAAEEGVDSMLLEAPSTSKGKKKHEGDLQLKLPADALPSEHQRSHLEAQDAMLAVPSALAGFQPDMDPHLRQTLEALDDDEFVTDEDAEGDLFGELLGGGELPDGGQLEFEFAEWGVEEGGEDEDPEDGAERSVGDEDDLRARIAAFKHSKAEADSASRSAAASEDDDELGEAADTLPPLAVIGGKRRRKGAQSDASGYSMSSASVFRHEGLRTLDDRFDQMEKQYGGGSDDESDEEHSDGPEFDEEGSDADAPELVVRDDFNAVMDEFLEQYEQVGNTVRPALRGVTGLEKLDTIRRALGEVIIREGIHDEDDRDILMPADIDVYDKDRWDCDTILSTYTNVENHPALIRARNDRGLREVRKIRLNPVTGLPTVEDPSVPHSRKKEDTDSVPSFKATVARPKHETAEEKKARKAAVKQERQARRTEKKATKVAFSSERKAQTKGTPKVDATVRKM